MLASSRSRFHPGVKIAAAAVASKDPGLLGVESPCHMPIDPKTGREMFKGLSRRVAMSAPASIVARLAAAMRPSAGIVASRAGGRRALATAASSTSPVPPFRLVFSLAPGGTPISPRASLLNGKWSGSRGPWSPRSSPAPAFSDLRRESAAVLATATVRIRPAGRIGTARPSRVHPLGSGASEAACARFQGGRRMSAAVHRTSTARLPAGCARVTMKPGRIAAS